MSSLLSVVVSKQSTSADLVSGATQSSYAYIRAVNSALAQAASG